MMSIETESRVAKIFTALGEGERSIEISRQVLSENNDFNAYQLFKVLDSEGKNRVDPCNLIEFLKRRSIYPTHEDAQFVIQFYDEDGDGALSYSEFLNLVQSSNSFKSHINSSSAQQQQLSFNIEYSMGKLLEKEVELARNMDYLIHDAKLRCDFNVHELYHLMQGYNSITSDSLKQFLERQNVQCLDSDIKAIIKRLDINRDGRVDLYELSTFFGCPLCHCGHCSCCSCSCSHHHHHLPICLRSSSSISNSPLRQSQGIEKEREREDIQLQKQNQKQMASSNTSGFKSTFQTASPQKYNEKIAEVASSSSEVMKVSPNLSLRLSPERKFNPNTEQRNSPLRNSQQQKDIESNNNDNMKSSTANTNYEEKQFMDYLKAIMESESTIERMKIDLALRCDFNVEDAFRVFELNGRGFITEDDLKYGLNLLNVFATNSDIKKLMKRYDLQGKGTLNYGDFFDMVTPYEKDYRSMVENRPPNLCCCCRCLDAFTCLTRTYLQSLLRTLISTETKSNELKMGFSSLRSKLETIFASLDLYNLGYFTDSDLESYLKRRNVFALQRECDLLFIHLDRNRDGRIEYWEMSDEFTPVY